MEGASSSTSTSKPGKAKDALHNNSTVVVSSQPSITPQSVLNLPLLDPAKWGWTAGGGVADLLTPHERARRKDSKKAFLKRKRKRDRTEVALLTTPVDFAATANNHVEERGLLENQQPAVLEDVDLSTPSTHSKGTQFNNDKNNATTNTIGGSVRFSALSNVPASPSAAAPVTGTAGVSAAANTNTTTTTSVPAIMNGPPDSSKSQCQKPTLPQHQLDAYTYHRGREGWEYRNADTGQLVADAPLTDTNAGKEFGSRVATVVVTFPWDDTNDNNSKAKRGGQQPPEQPRRYRETIEWDLMDPHVMTPLQYGEQLVEQFGLDYDQMLDVVTSIERQLQSCVEQTSSYAAPIATKDYLGQPTTRDVPAASVPVLFSAAGGSGGNTKRPSKPPLRSSLATRSGSDKRNRKRDSSGGNYAGSGGSSAVEYIYEVQVRHRLLTASRAMICQPSPAKSGPLLFGSGQCHICTATPNGTNSNSHSGSNNTNSTSGGKAAANVSSSEQKCGLFGCRLPGHAYCLAHLKEKCKLDESSSASDKGKLDHCPVCALVCTCTCCSRTVELVASELKRRCLEQGSTPEATKFEDILVYSRQCAVASRKRKKYKKGGSAAVPSASTVRRKVPQAPISMFPREVCQGLDVDPGSPLDYHTVFTANGPILPKHDTNSLMQGTKIVAKEAVTVQPTDPNVIIEDGSVDFCNKCRKHGNLLCCDYCPRAFHADCINAKMEEIESDAPWECPACLDEQKGLTRDQITGSKSLPMICAAFDDLSAHVSEQCLAHLRVLAILHEMCLELMQYDFGQVFSRPVDPTVVTTYSKFVKEPMDLGTVASKLVNGQYTQHHQGNAKLDGNSSLDETVLAVLKDIELVWHNCFTFNCEGSAVYRMAEVQRRRAAQIRRASFDHLLPHQVRDDLAAYVAACIKARKSTTKNLKYKASEPTRHKVALPPAASKLSTRRSVVILHPNTGRPAKFYSTIQSAMAAASLLFKLNVPCECEALQMSASLDNGGFNQKLRKLIKSSCTDPSLLLFGYRWLLWDDLNRKRVVFDKTDSHLNREEISNPRRLPVDLIELRLGDYHTTFLSIQEAVQHPGLIGDLQKVKRDLPKLGPGERLVDDCGRSWRRQLLNKAEALNRDSSHSPGASDARHAMKQNMASSQKNIGERSATSTSSKVEVRGSVMPRAQVGLDDERALPVDLRYIKRDLVSGVLLAGFPTVQAAFVDFQVTVEGSPLHEEEIISLETFKSEFLEGSGNVGGVVWRKRSLVNSSTKQKAPFGSQGSSSVGKPSLGKLKSLKEES